ncbi:hypothetical protein CK203_076057 [Vitis vinifera]|uniref:DUF4283 domain-containing protein n=1 Tax=Vitis vinifera TaxID=29760 RepID=A0A438ELY3_VITVI|nr:hypothetical protein CK203_076057 [Vitis vinifera]
MVASKVREGLRGGKCWFAVESKTFEISIEVGKLGVKKKLSLRCLKVWEDGGRKFRLECQLNEASRFLLCSVRDVKAKNEQSFPGVPIFEKVGCSFKEKVKRTYADAMRVKTGEPREYLWLHFGDRELLCKEEQLSHCLVGCFGDNSDLVPPPSSLKGWVIARWALRGEEGRGLKISKLGEIDDLRRESLSCKDGDPKWVFSEWEPCQGSLATMGTYLGETTRKDLPGSLQVLVGHTCFVVRLWWEAPPWFLRSEEQFKYGRRNRGVVGVAGRSAKGTVLDSDFLGLGSRTASCVEKKGKEVLGSSEWEQEKPTSGAGWAVGSNPPILWMWAWLRLYGAY